MMATQPENSLRTTLFIAMAVLCCASLVDSQGPQSRTPIIVQVHREQGQLVFKLEPDPNPGKDILWGLSALVEKRGQNYPVVALVDDSAKISDIDQVPGIAAKAGFGSVRTFIVRHGTGKMVEIKFCSALPLSTNPPGESTCVSTK
jgi:hypothetical protein